MFVNGLFGDSRSAPPHEVAILCMENAGNMNGVSWKGTRKRAILYRTLHDCEYLTVCMTYFKIRAGTRRWSDSRNYSTNNLHTINIQCKCTLNIYREIMLVIYLGRALD